MNHDNREDDLQEIFIVIVYSSTELVTVHGQMDAFVRKKICSVMSVSKKIAGEKTGKQ